MNKYTITEPTIMHIKAQNLKNALKKYYLETGSSKATVNNRTFNMERNSNKLHITKTKTIQKGGTTNTKYNEIEYMQYMKSLPSYKRDNEVLNKPVYYDIISIPSIKQLNNNYVKKITNIIAKIYDVRDIDVIIFDKVHRLNVANKLNLVHLPYVIFGVGISVKNSDIFKVLIRLQIKKELGLNCIHYLLPSQQIQFENFIVKVHKLSIEYKTNIERYIAYIVHGSTKSLLGTRKVLELNDYSVQHFQQYESLLYDTTIKK